MYHKYPLLVLLSDAAFPLLFLLNASGAQSLRATLQCIIVHGSPCSSLRVMAFLPDVDDVATSQVGFSIVFDDMHSTKVPASPCDIFRSLGRSELDKSFDFIVSSSVEEGFMARISGSNNTFLFKVLGPHPLCKTAFLFVFTLVKLRFHESLTSFTISDLFISKGKAQSFFFCN